MLDQEDHGMVVVRPYVGMVAEVRGDQDVPEAPGEAVGQAPEEAVDIEFLLEVDLCLEVQYGQKKRSTGKKSMGKRNVEKTKGRSIGKRWASRSQERRHRKNISSYNVLINVKFYFVFRSLSFTAHSAITIIKQQLVASCYINVYEYITYVCTNHYNNIYLTQ